MSENIPDKRRTEIVRRIRNLAYDARRVNVALVYTASEHAWFRKPLSA